jgi:hypothetical protein
VGRNPGDRAYPICRVWGLPCIRFALLSRYVREIASPDGVDHVLVFEARIGDKQLAGSDFLHHRADGTIDEFTVMVRPLNAALALADAMRTKLAAAPG